MEDIDKLTRKLMEGTAERPSSTLNERIMRLIFSEKSLRRRIVYVEPLPRIGAIAGGILVYLALILLLFVYCRMEGVTSGSLLEMIRPYSPLLLLASCAIPLYLLGVWVDQRWMKRRKEIL